MSQDLGPEKKKGNKNKKMSLSERSNASGNVHNQVINSSFYVRGREHEKEK